MIAMPLLLHFQSTQGLLQKQKENVCTRVCVFKLTMIDTHLHLFHPSAETMHYFSKFQGCLPEGRQKGGTEKGIIAKLRPKWY
jgi:hypothetical protein